MFGKGFVRWVKNRRAGVTIMVDQLRWLGVGRRVGKSNEAIAEDISMGEEESGSVRMAFCRTYYHGIWGRRRHS